MRVLHVMASGARGGGADHLLGLLPHLRLLGVDCLAAVGGDGPLLRALRSLGIPAQQIDLMHSRWDPRSALAMRSLVLHSGADVVHYHGTRAAFYGSIATLGGAQRAVYTAHGLSYRKDTPAWQHAVFVAVERFICLAVWRVISVSRADLEDLQRRRFVRPDAGHHIPNAVDTERFKLGDRVAARAALGLPADSLVVGTVSRLVPGKAVADLIDAMRAMRGIDAWLVIVGDGPLRAKLERQAAGQRVRFLGSRGDVEHILPSFDLFVLPSLWEGEPITLLEALACGLPVIATATDGAREVLNECGLLVPVGEPEALQKEIERVLSDDALRQQIALHARASVLSRSYAAQARQVLAVYSGCLAKTARKSDDGKVQ